MMDELRKWGSTVTAEELARAIDSLPPAKPVSFGGFGFSSIEGPLYADRVNGRLTFRDWESWDAEDQAQWRDEYLKRTGYSD